jgi:O-methyltransferase involved in polyketide biosynthesis
VDNDPVVAVHSRALINPDRHTRTVTADLRQPDTVLAAKGLADLIDLTRPVGLLLIAVAHFLDPTHAAHIVDRYMRALPAGSMLAISAAQRDGADPATLATLEQTYAESPTPVYLRTRAQVLELFADLPLIDPGLTDITQWRAHGYRGSLPVGCGVAVKNG